MSDVFPRATALRKLALTMMAIAVICVIVGGAYAVIRGTGTTDTQTKAGYCLALVAVSCAIVVYATLSGFTAAQFGAFGQFCLVVLLGLIWRFDHWYLTWLGVIPLVFGIILFTSVIKMHRALERQKTPKTKLSEPLVSASAAH